MAKLVIIFVALFGAAFAIAGSFIFYSQVLRGRKQTEAEILSAGVESFETNDEGRVRTAYRAKYQVRLQAEGRVIEVPVSGNRSSGSADEARTKSLANPVGSRRTVYYLPSRPEDIVLDPPGRRFGISLLFLSIGLTVLAGSVLMWRMAQPLKW